ncbi:D-2-hydroxyacid dehydrogenase [Cuneatibacter sp. NSJ-177]|uniref:D-2-hydroxyacid dehydrogenase n=1 Tax=Cuneatibacter sp. NSJ-177 TaxID=2931401 RepID=UPI001FD100B4|nr:D-2-hydroxyacid dehydrogenase [Cuneatibacter sp. NSJ-177]MCJ7837379.1 D-2-hydroxyacid dehydrogenase [Cuneatibacter sp. NSJ-177]
MVRILVTDGIAKSAVEKLEAAGFEVVMEFCEPEVLEQKVREFDALIVRSATKVRKPALDAAAEAGRLKLIIRGGVGLDNIDVAYAKEKGIEVKNTPNASSISVAEMAIGHIFSVARNLAFANVTMRQGAWEKKACAGVELFGKTLGLIGLGRIGAETAKRAKALGMDVIYTTRSGPKAGAGEYRFVSLDELLARSDFISLHLPAAKDADPLINRETIAKMKDGVCIINTARGVLVDEDALLEALNSGKVSGAGLDVYREEPTRNEALCAHPKVSVTPHVGASTMEAQEHIGEEIVEHIRKQFSA